MGLFSKFKKEKTAVDWSNAYTATPKFYAKPDGSPFGAIALTEGTETILPTVFNYCIWNCTYRCFASRSTKL